MIDDARSVTDQIEPVAVRDRNEGDTEEVVFRHHLPHVQPIVKALDAMHGRIPPYLFIRDRALATEREIARDFRHQVGQVIRQREVVKVPLAKHLPRVHAPFLDDFFVAAPEDIREMRHRAMLQTRHEDVTLSWQPRVRDAFRRCGRHKEARMCEIASGNRRDVIIAGAASAISSKKIVFSMRWRPQH